MDSILVNPFEEGYSPTRSSDIPKTFEPVGITGATVPGEAAPIDVSFRDVGPAGNVSAQLQLDQYNLDRLMHRVRQAHGEAIAAKGKVDRDAVRDRQAYDLEDKVQAYKGQPNITLPLTRNKVDGGIGQLIAAAFDSDTIAAADPLTDEAVDVAPIYDALMDRELKLDGADQTLKMSLREAAIVGTSFVGFNLTRMSTGETAIQANLVRLENFHFFPLEVDDLSDCTTFERYTMPYFRMKEQAAAGVFDPGKVAEMKNRYGSSQPLTKEAKDAQSQTSFWDDETATKELLRVYIRYTPESKENLYASTPTSDLRPPTLYQVICEKSSFLPLSVKPNPLREAIDMPPYAPMRIAKRAGWLPGGSWAKLLRAVQKIADDAMNDRMAYNKFAITPVIQGDSSNPIFQRLEKTGGRLVPGTVIPTNGRPDMAGIQALQLPSPVVTIEDLNLAVEWADQGTHSDFQLSGQMPTKRATLGEVQMARGAGELKLRVNMLDFADDFTNALKMAWALIDAYKVDPQGVMEVSRDGATHLVSSDEITPEMMSEQVQAMVQEAQQSQDMETLQELATKIKMVDDPMTGMPTGVIEKIGDYKLTKGGVPSTRRGDIGWGLASMSTVADKATLRANLDAFAPYMQWLPQADMDTRTWEFLKMRAVAADIKGYKKFLGADPKRSLPPEAFAQMQQPVQENLAKRSAQ